MGRSRYRFIYPDHPHFITLTVLHWIPVFVRPETVQILLDSLRFLQKEGLKVHAWVVLENHMHLVVSSPDIERHVARFKSFTAKQLLMHLDKRGASAIMDQLKFYKKAHKVDRGMQFWQEGVHPEWISSDVMMHQKIDYIHMNPVKRGYVDEAEQWRYSSARDYVGEMGLLPVDKVW